MSFIESVSINKFRNVKELKINFNSLNVCFYGNNAVGKTNIIEAIYLLANSKSFRYCQLSDLINYKNKKASVESVIVNNDLGKFNLEYKLNKDKKNYKLNSNVVNSIKDIYSRLRIVSYTPSSYQIILGSENQRRVYFDRVAFSIDSKHLNNLIYYNKLIKNRNLLIRQNNTLYIYDELIAEISEQIIKLRTKASEYVQNHCSENFISYFNNIKTLNIKYKTTSGVNKTEILDNLLKNRKKDMNYLCTCSGVHRDYFEIKVDDVSVKKYFSTGQSKLLSLLFKLAKIQIIYKYSKIKPVFMFDDAGTFLDKDRFLQVVDNIKEIKSQIFFTSTDISLFEGNLFDSVQLLKVEKGEVIYE